MARILVAIMLAVTILIVLALAWAAFNLAPASL